MHLLWDMHFTNLAQFYPPMLQISPIINGKICVNRGQTCQMYNPDLFAKVLARRFASGYIYTDNS